MLPYLYSLNAACFSEALSSLTIYFYLILPHKTVTPFFIFEDKKLTVISGDLEGSEAK